MTMYIYLYNFINLSSINYMYFPPLKQRSSPRGVLDAIPTRFTKNIYEAHEPHYHHHQHTLTKNTYRIPQNGYHRGPLRWYEPPTSPTRRFSLTVFFLRARLDCCHWRHRIAVAASLYTCSNIEAYNTMGNALLADLHPPPPFALNRQAHCRCFPLPSRPAPRACPA